MKMKIKDAILLLNKRDKLGFPKKWESYTFTPGHATPEHVRARAASWEKSRK